MLDENPIFDSEDVSGDPTDRLAEAGKPAMNHDEIPVGDDGTGFILESRW